MRARVTSVSQVFDDYADGRITAEEGARLLTPPDRRPLWLAIATAIALVALVWLTF